MLIFEKLHPQAEQEMMGFIPHYFPAVYILGVSRPAEDYIREGYRVTAGTPPNEYFNTKSRFTMDEDGSLNFPGDPKMKPLMKATWGYQTLFFYEAEILSVRNTDGTFLVWRLD